VSIFIYFVVTSKKFIFDEFERRKNMEYNMYISFMEIYNENAFDLLNRQNLEKPLEKWGKVFLYL
jgi:kinesin family protein 6/9